MTQIGDVGPSDLAGRLHYLNHLYLAWVTVEVMPAQLKVNVPRNYHANLTLNYSVQLLSSLESAGKLTMTRFMLLYSRRHFGFDDCVSRDTSL